MSSAVSNQSILRAITAILLPVLLLLTLRITYYCADGESDVDNFYHAAMAQQGPAVFAAKTFPAAAMSVWQDTFSDKELGFHTILYGCNQLGKLFGFSADALFDWGNALLLLLLFFAFYLALRQLRANHLWFWSLLLITVDPLLTERMLQLRPHLLAMTLFCLTVAALNTPSLVRGRRKYLTALAAGMLFGYTYSNPHFVLIVLGAYALIHFIRHRRWQIWLMPTTGIAGIAIALTLHPQFPNSFYIWQLQGVEVVKNMVCPAADTVLLGSELTIHGGKSLLQSPLLMVLAILLFYRQPWRGNLRRQFLWLLALVTFAGMLLAFRMIEYGVISLLLFAAVRWPQILTPPLRRALAAGILALSLLWCGIFFYRVWRPSLQPYHQTAQWARQHLPPGSVIGHLAWSDFPQLYYAMPEYRFLVGLDPTFAAKAYREKMLVLDALMRGRRFTPPAQMRRIIGSDYLFVSHEGDVAAKRLYFYGYAPVFSSSEGVIFDLTLPLHSNKPANLPRLSAD